MDFRLWLKDGVPSAIGNKMLIDPTDVLELVMVSAKESLAQSHGILIGSVSEFEAMERGHSLSLARRRELTKALETWDEERLWFTSNRRSGVTLEEVCDAAGTNVEIVRAFYQDLLAVPFNFKKAHSRLMWETSLAGEFCGICLSERCEEIQTRVHNEGRTDRERLAGSDRLRLAGSDSVHRTEETGRGAEGS